MLTLCMIVKNEADNLCGCLARVAGFVDEIVIVDTGSTDETKQIAADFTNKIYDFAWCNDFAAARNFSLAQAKHDWVLVLDADEYVEQFSRQAVSRFIQKKGQQHTVGRIQRVNVLDDISGSRKILERINRLFNRNFFAYDGIIHEQVVEKTGADYHTGAIDIVVEHIGYTQEALQRTDKLRRNISLLTEALAENPDDPYYYYQLGKSYYMLKDYELAYTNFVKALSFEVNVRLEYVADLVETYGYTLINSGKYTEALCLEKFTDYYRSSPDFCFLMGLVYMNNAKFSLAVERFLQCTKLPNGKVEGITTYLPYYNVGVIHEVLGVKAQASHYYKLCGEYKPALARGQAL
ncbi:SPBc2 prophage-derived glycosyltransferase SunS [Sporomusa ovata DSM 2662]|uniref:Glycosyl transferase, family 2 n=1 Tax=Sporomusa ovata TaxID=2378 RepID=A0A0U1KU72_9FIRM|nr:glycosyltransferase family 2 protein [Sporomusa ovata]EQB26353.1 glycosyltransferase involved in cell wall biogenesis [Sporomusa ovata DSM 2662]CQR70433.1 Glycosyl transferase, family 2 [Sporomusa ovata]